MVEGNASYCRYCGRTLLCTCDRTASEWSVGHKAGGPVFLVDDSAIAPNPAAIWKAIREKCEARHYDEAQQKVTQNSSAVWLTVTAKTEEGKTIYVVV